MTQTAIQSKLTFVEYVDFCVQTEERYELARGSLKPMTPPTVLHYRIAKFLEQMFDRAIQQQFSLDDWETFREAGQKTGEDSSRLPDLVIVAKAEANHLLKQTAIFQNPALLIVEIVSLTSVNQDYEEKLKEYQAIGISEYWVVDPEGWGTTKHIGLPKAPTVTIYQLIGGKYQPQRFQGEDRIISPTFPTLALTVAQIVQGKQ
jgi:Uma2 family endonuclease